MTDSARWVEGIRSPALYPAELRALNTLRPTSWGCSDFCGYSQLPLRFRFASQDFIHRIQSLKRPFHALGRWMDVFLRNRHRRVPHDLHDRERVGIRSGLTQTGSEGVPQGMYHKFL